MSVRQNFPQGLANSRTEELKRRVGLPVEEGFAQSASASGAHAAASAAMVNRTHRIVRERARTIQARRSRVRSLWLPLAVCSGLLVVICAAIWSVLDEYELVPTGMPDASQQMFVLLMWCLPLSAVLIALVWFRRAGTRIEGGGIQ
ncbi:hypothetical protein [Granulicella tundricola]|uniref:Uncharacterized protein n=1 Tax=Granulicella tundricola (strain ATCC BAA-1859 / DSM 23138 / MP5ACTX9) TaxID=1198114 RepID=E8X1I0_GRATM|nr:hypothetical protein [Granulicella tundricola]ADW70215.1 hypothetical protein AciX9_3204 [Granulicella tundricola MP5ACTX9]